MTLKIEFERQRTPPEIISFSLHLYFGFKLSLRDVEARLLEEHNLERSCEAVRLWVQRTNRATHRYFARPLRHVHRIVVDESEIRVAGEWVWLWAALERGFGVEAPLFPLETAENRINTTFFQNTETLGLGHYWGSYESFIAQV